MYISNVHIENFRNFSTVDVPLKQFTIKCVNEFISKMHAIYEGSKDNFSSDNYAEELIKNAPRVIIRLLKGKTAATADC